MAHPNSTSKLTSELLARHDATAGDVARLARLKGMTINPQYVFSLLNGTIDSPTPSMAYAIAHALGEPLHVLRPDLAPDKRRNDLIEPIAARIAEGKFSVKRLADAANIDDAWVYNALSGKTLPDPVTAALCDALDLPAPEGTTPPSVEAPAPMPAPTAELSTPLSGEVLAEAPPGWIPAAEASRQAGHDRDYARYVAKGGRVPSLKVKAPTPTGYAWYVRAEDFPDIRPGAHVLPTATPAPSAPIPAPESPTPPPASAVAPQPVVAPAELVRDTSEEDLLWLLIQAVSVAARNTAEGLICDTAWQLAMTMARTLKELATKAEETPAHQLQIISVLEGLIDPAAGGNLSQGTMLAVLGNVLRSRKSEDTLTGELLRGLDQALALKDERSRTDE